MAIEEEFSIEIPDKDADEMRTVGDAVKYISEASEYLPDSFVQTDFQCSLIENGGTEICRLNHTPSLMCLSYRRFLFELSSFN